MAKIMATKERVFEHAQALSNQGIAPTILMVQEALGGGSYSTVKRYLDQWKQAAHQPQRELPEPAMEPLLGLGRQFWALLDQQATLQIESARHDASEQIATIQGQLDQAEQAIARLEANTEQLAHLAEERELAIATLQREKQAHSERAAAAEARANTLQAGLADFKAELERVHSQLQADRQIMDKLRHELTVAAEERGLEIATLQREKQAHSERATAAEARANTLQAGMVDFKAEMERVHRQLLAERQTMDQLRHELTTAAVERGTLDSELKTLRRQVPPMHDVRPTAKGKAKETPQL